tara:strand:+ start:153 stop:779 length:627 start_codon:yes stop_codon:yes gene_type:complete
MADQAELNVNNTPNEFECLMNMASALDEEAKMKRAQATELRKTAKALQKQMKVLQTKGKKRVRDPNAPKRQPAGFAKPTVLSPELYEFLGIESSTLVARTDVTKKITEYIREKNLQNPENRREILLDAPLRKLLNPPADVKVTFFTLQTYLKVHFPSSKGNDKKEDSVSTESVTTKPAPVVSAKPSVEAKKLAVKKKLANSGRSKVSA